MSIDRSLKMKNSLVRHRNVLKRSERLEILEDEEKWSEDKDSLLGLPKVAHRKTVAGKKVKKAKEEEAETTGKKPAGTAS